VRSIWLWSIFRSLNMRPGKDYMAKEDDLNSIMRQRHFCLSDLTD
jgi:hypothetical protein